MNAILKTVSLILVAVLMVAVLAACGGNPADKGGKDTTPSDTKPSNGRDTIEDTVPTDLNYADRSDNTITFFARNNMDIFKYELCCEELMNDTLYDAIHYRNIDVENRLGVKIKQILQAGAYGPDENAWFEVLSTAVNTNSSDYDGAAIRATKGASLAPQNLYYNLNDVSTQYGDGYLDLEKPWWNQSIVDDCTMYGVLYFLGGDLTVSETYGTHLLWFNKDLFNEKFPEEGFKTLYDYVDDGTWTIDKMANYVSQVWDDVNTSGVVDDGDTVGFKYWHAKHRAQMDSWLYAMDIDVLERDAYGDYSVADFGSRLIPAFELVEGMYHGEGAMINPTGAPAEDLTSFRAGNVLFILESIGGGVHYRSCAFNYGCLPMPKFNAEQEEYGNGMWTTSSLMVLLSNLSPERAKMVSAVLELMAAESYKQVTPVYYSKVITGHYSKDEADARMFDIALATCRYGFETIYGSAMDKSIVSFFQALDSDVQQTIDSKSKDVWPTKLQTLLEGLEEIS